MYNDLYTPTEWASLRSRCRFDAVKDAAELFKANCASSEFDSRYVGVRESRDSADGRNSVPFIIGFDVTGNNSYIARYLATNIINELLTIYERGFFGGNMHVLTAAIGDIKHDMTPLQVTNFRSDIKLYDELMNLHLEGGGGGEGVSYDLLWYFAAKHTVSDHFEKRGKKGFLFTIGTNRFHPDLSVVEIGRAFGDDEDDSLTCKEVLQLAERYYNVFHIHLTRGTTGDKHVLRKWREAFPTNVTELKEEDIRYLPELMATITAYASGCDVQSIMKSFAPETAVKLARPLGFIINDNRSGGSIIF